MQQMKFEISADSSRFDLEWNFTTRRSKNDRHGANKFVLR
jgi:hypothetical protein